MALGICYQHKWVRCGKPKCHCADPKTSPGHGPYWYVFARGDDQELRCLYIGRDFRLLSQKEVREHFKRKRLSRRQQVKAWDAAQARVD
jgi:hypothetical protein